MSTAFNTRAPCRTVAAFNTSTPSRTLAASRASAPSRKSAACHMPAPSRTSATPPIGAVRTHPTARVQKRHRNQPPQRRINTPQVPEIRLTTLQVHELRDLPVGRLVLRQRMQPSRGFAFQQLVARHHHPKRTHGRISPKNRRVAAQVRALTWRGRQNPTRRKVSSQQLDRPRMAGVEELTIAGTSRNRTHIDGMIATLRPWSLLELMLIYRGRPGSDRPSARVA